MKFAQYLKAVEEEAPPQFKKTFLKYKSLKKAVKRIRDGEKIDRQKDDDFYNELEREVKAVNRHFEKEAQSIIKKYDSAHDHTILRDVCEKTLCKLFSGSRPNAQMDELGLEAEWCRRYANINAVALRKILKKHDKSCGLSTGHEWLQAFWSGKKSEDGMFLHSPLLVELRALESLLGHEEIVPTIGVSVCQRDQPDESEVVQLPAFPTQEMFRSSPVEMLLESAAAQDDRGPDYGLHYGTRGGPLGEAAAHDPQSGGLDEEEDKHSERDAADDAADAAAELATTQSLASSGFTEDVEDEYKCPICLEPMYHPIGLSCGHAFCADCAFVAVGKAYSLGTVRAIMMHVPDEACCPECRQPNVFRAARELKEVGRLIKQRYPLQTDAKESALRAKKAHLRRLLSEKRTREERCSVTMRPAGF